MYRDPSPALTNHDRSAMNLKVVSQIPTLGGKFFARAHRQKLGLNLASLFQNESHLRGPDPLTRSDKVAFLVANVHQTLLDLGMVWNLGLGVALVTVPRYQGLERSIGAPPAIIVEAVLHVMMVRVGAVDKVNLASRC